MMGLVDYGSDDDDEVVEQKEEEKPKSTSSLFSKLPPPKSSKSNDVDKDVDTKKKVVFTVPVNASLVSKRKNDNGEYDDDSEEDDEGLKQKKKAKRGTPTGILTFLPAPKNDYVDDDEDNKKKDIPLRYQKKDDNSQSGIKTIDTMIAEKPKVPTEMKPKAVVENIQKENDPSTPAEAAKTTTQTVTKAIPQKAAAAPIKRSTQPSKANLEFAKKFSFRSEVVQKPVEIPAPVVPEEIEVSQDTQNPGYVDPNSYQGYVDPNYVDPNYQNYQNYADPNYQYYQQSMEQNYQQQQQMPSMPKTAPPPAFFGRNQRDMATATFKEIRQDDFRGDISQFQLQNRDTTQEMNTFTDLLKQPKSDRDLVIPSRDSRKQHQITYLLYEAKQKAADIEAKRASGYRNAREARAKYGW